MNFSVYKEFVNDDTTATRVQENGPPSNHLDKG
jgi:hypothetical protein